MSAPPGSVSETGSSRGATSMIMPSSHGDETHVCRFAVRQCAHGQSVGFPIKADVVAVVRRNGIAQPPGLEGLAAGLELQALQLVFIDGSLGHAAGRANRMKVD